MLCYYCHMAAKTWDEVYGEGAQQPASTFPCKACGWTGPIKTDLNSPTALKGLAIEVLVQIVETAPRNVSLVAAIRELIDRVEGKAPQNVNMSVKTDPAASLSDDQLAALLAMLPEPMIIPPLPKRLDD